MLVRPCLLLQRSHPDDVAAALAAEAEGGEVAAEGGDAATAGSDADVLPQQMLRKYITYAKQTCRPKLQAADYDKIAKVYAELRRESSVTHGMPIAVRHLESMIRMSEARAAMHLREYVNDDDIDCAIRIMLESFVATQKLSVQKALRKKFRKYIHAKADFNGLVLLKLQECLRDARRVEAITGQQEDRENYVVPTRQLEERCRDLDITDLHPFFSSATFREAGFRLGANGASVLLGRA
jgi:DNA replication licensing factor MCM2